MARTSTAEDWRVYYQRTGGRPPRETLLQALASFEAEDAVGTAVDLGCGGGRDSIELLRRGWSVLAIDAQDSAIETLLARPELNQFGCRPRTEVSRFEAARWEMADLVNSSFALPLCPKADFLAMWKRIFDSLRPGGRFAGQVTLGNTALHHDIAFTRATGRNHIEAGYLGAGDFRGIAVLQEFGKCIHVCRAQVGVGTFPMPAQGKTRH
jgi:trans-aconitate methyltransferase